MYSLCYIFKGNVENCCEGQSKMQHAWSRLKDIWIGEHSEWWRKKEVPNEGPGDICSKCKLVKFRYSGNIDNCNCNYSFGETLEGMPQFIFLIIKQFSYEWLSLILFLTVTLMIELFSHGCLTLIIELFSYEQLTLIIEQFSYEWLTLIIKQFSYEWLTLIIKQFSYEWLTLIIKQFSYEWMTLIIKQFSYEWLTLIIKQFSYEWMTLIIKQFSYEWLTLIIEQFSYEWMTLIIKQFS